MPWLCPGGRGVVEVSSWSAHYWKSRLFDRRRNTISADKNLHYLLEIFKNTSVTLRQFLKASAWPEKFAKPLSLRTSRRRGCSYQKIFQSTLGFRNLYSLVFALEFWKKLFPKRNTPVSLITLVAFFLSLNLSDRACSVNGRKLVANSLGHCVAKFKFSSAILNSSDWCPQAHALRFFRPVACSYFCCPSKIRNRNRLETKITRNSVHWSCPRFS